MMVSASRKVGDKRQHLADRPCRRASARVVVAVSCELVGIVQLLDQMPDGVVQTPATVWSVFARSLGEQGAGGRTALAWRWALTGACPSPLTLSEPQGQLPARHQLAAEADAAAELGGSAVDPGGQVMHARFVLQWLAGHLDALPLWNGGPEDLRVTDGAAFPHKDAEIDEVHWWAMLTEWRHPWPDNESAPEPARMASGSARGTAQLLGWVCGETADGPLTGRPAGFGRPSLYEVSLEVRPAMAALDRARDEGNPDVAARIEAMMEAFLWLAGWNRVPPVDRHGHRAAEECAERDTPCSCGDAGSCLRGDCPACRRAPCVHGFGEHGAA